MSFSGISIRLRLFIAWGILVLSTLVIILTSVYFLNYVDTKVQKLHYKSVAQISHVLSMARDVSDIASYAPLLLSIESNYLVESMVDDLLYKMDSFDKAWAEIKTTVGLEVIPKFEEEVSGSITRMKGAVRGILASVLALGESADKMQQARTNIETLEVALAARISGTSNAGQINRVWIELSHMAKALKNALQSENLITLGEHRRRFNLSERYLKSVPLQAAQRGYFERLTHMSFPGQSQDLFRWRYTDIVHKKNARSALFQISENAIYMSGLFSKHVSSVESLLSSERLITSRDITYTSMIIIVTGFISIILASLSALYMSGYVITNIKSISDAMVKLSKGERNTRLDIKSTFNDEIGNLYKAFLSFRSVIIRLDRTNLKLKQNNTLLENIFVNMSEGLAVSNSQGIIMAANPNILKILGLPDDMKLPGKTIHEIFNQAFGAQSFSVEPFMTSKTRSIETLFVGENVIEMRASFLPDGKIVWVVSDVTELKRVEERIQKIAHIEALGKLTGEVAHDFGNILSSISTNVYRLQQNSRQKTSASILQSIVISLDFGTSLVHRLLAFAKKQPLLPRVVDIGELIRGMSGLIEVALKEKAHLDIRIPDGQFYVLMDSGQLENTIFNLFLNANQAIHDSGTISIELGCDEAFIHISIIDDGEGMDDDILSSVFEPFFTTRASEGGTGLGLSTAYGFMKQSGGDIHIESRKGEGTHVTLSFPRTVAMPDEVDNRTGRKRVLLVEDDIITLEKMYALFETLSFHVTQAGSFSDAQKALSSGAVFDILITDLYLDNGRQGWDVIAFSRSFQTWEHIIVCSTHLRGERPEGFPEDMPIVFMSKPLTREKILSVTG